ncbi:MAG: hypothetical protein RSB41_03855 [Bacilli bacterium]
MPELKLNRIDYRYDKIINDKEKRILLIKLYNKNDEKKAYMKKTFVFHKSSKKNNKHCSLRYLNKSKSCNVYDKEEEREAKFQEILDYEKNIIRYEAQIKRKHILYMKKRYNIDDSFEIYFTPALYNLFMDKVVVSSIGISDYYNLYYASKKIKFSMFKDTDKEELIKFLRNISNNGRIHNCKELYSKYKYDKLLKQLGALNINPILIPKNDPITIIENPIKDIFI